MSKRSVRPAVRKKNKQNVADPEFEYPVFSPEGACLQFVCSNGRFSSWLKIIKLRYWLHFGQVEHSDYDVKWKDTKTKAGQMLQHLIKVSSTVEQEESRVNLFTLNVYCMKKKIMVQGSHKDLWLKKEFPLLRKLVDDCINGKDLSECYFLVTGVRIEFNNNEDLLPSDNEEDLEGEDQSGPRPSAQPTPILYDTDEDDIENKLKTPRRKLKTPIRKKKKTPMKPKADSNGQKTAAKSTEKPKKKNVSDNHDIELRLRNLEEVTCNIDSTLASQATNPILSEELIEEIVKCKIDERLKDLKEQNKNAISLLSKRVGDLEQQVEERVSALKNDIDKMKTRIANVNERCGKIEKSVKNFDHQTLANINYLKSELIEQMKEKFNIISNDKDQKEGLIEISSDHDYDTDKESVSSDSLHTQLKSKEVTIEQTVPSIIVSSKPPEFSPSKDNDFDCKAKTNFGNSSFHHQSDLVVLMDSNRRYLELDKLFPESNVRIIPCGNSEKAKSVITYPRCKEVKAILIHTGTNDLEDIGMDTKSITDNLIQAANVAHEKFPTANIFLSEILPRRDEFNLKGSEVNAILNSAAEHDKFDLIRESFFYDRKHLSKYQGVNVLKRNISSSLVKRLSFIKISESSLQSQRPN